MSKGSGDRKVMFTGSGVQYQKMETLWKWMAVTGVKLLNMLMPLSCPLKIRKNKNSSAKENNPEIKLSL